MKKTVWMVVMAGLLFGACTYSTKSRPDDFYLVLDWSTGALPPKYHYAYQVEIGPQPKGKVTYEHGYSSEENRQAWVKEFSLTSSDLDTLYKLISEKRMLRSNWAEGQMLLGGKSTAIKIFASGTVFEIPSISVLGKADRKNIETVIDAIRSTVPQSIWDEMAVLQAENEAKFED